VYSHIYRLIIKGAFQKIKLSSGDLEMELLSFNPLLSSYLGYKKKEHK
jgi:hypothetical protein